MPHEMCSYFIWCSESEPNLHRTQNINFFSLHVVVFSFCCFLILQIFLHEFINASKEMRITLHLLEQIHLQKQYRRLLFWQIN